MIRFFVEGHPAPGGSKTITYTADGSVAGLRDSGKGNAKWKRLVARAGKLAHKGPLLSGPLEVEMRFVRTRPKGHYRTGKFAHLLRADAPEFPAVKPDTLKLARSTEDALTSVIWTDDALIVDETLSKRYGDAPGVWVTVWEKE